MMHNPNHHTPIDQAYNGHRPQTSQPQQPLHVPFAIDPYTRRDPFLPAAPQHSRQSSQGIVGEGNAPRRQADGPGGWTNTGTISVCAVFHDMHLAFSVEHSHASAGY